MDSTTTPAVFLLLLSIVTIYHTVFGAALHVDVYPERVNELVDQEVNITCHFGESTNWDGNVIMVELGKEGERPIAILRKAKLNYGPDRKMNVKAEGCIVKNSTQSFLRLTISDPGAGDAGTYSCSIFYTDGFGVMKESKEEAHVTVDNDYHKVVLVHLLKKVSDLEKTADTQDKILKEHDAQAKVLEKDLKDQQDSTKVLENTVAQQKIELKGQQGNTNVLEKELEDQQNNTNVLKNTMAQQKKELKDQQGNTNLLENTVAQQKKELKDQQDNTNVLEKELKDQQDNTSVLENTVAQQEKELKDQQHITKVLENTMAQQKKELKDQQDNTKVLENTVAQQKIELKDQQDNTNVLEKELKDQQNNTNVLKNTMAQQKKELKDQQNNTNVLKNTMAQQKKELKDQQDITKDLEKRVKDQQDNTNVLKNTVAQQKKELKDQQDKMNALEKTVALEKKQLENQRAKEIVRIAFNYAYDDIDKLVEGQPMLFTHGIMSFGGAYDPKSGVFTAPRDGLYVFHLAVMTHIGDKIDIYLKANDRTLTRLYVKDADGNDQASVSSVTPLKAGDQVKPMLFSIFTKDNLAWSSHFSTFSGYLLKLF